MGYSLRFAIVFASLVANALPSHQCRRLLLLVFSRSTTAQQAALARDIATQVTPPPRTEAEILATNRQSNTQLRRTEGWAEKPVNHPEATAPSQNLTPETDLGHRTFKDSLQSVSVGGNTYAVAGLAAKLKVMNDRLHEKVIPDFCKEEAYQLMVKEFGENSELHRNLEAARTSDRLTPELVEREFCAAADRVQTQFQERLRSIRNERGETLADLLTLFDIDPAKVWTIGWSSTRATRNNNTARTSNSAKVMEAQWAARLGAQPDAPRNVSWDNSADGLLRNKFTNAQTTAQTMNRWAALRAERPVQGTEGQRATAFKEGVWAIWRKHQDPGQISQFATAIKNKYKVDLGVQAQEVWNYMNSINSFSANPYFRAPERNRAPGNKLTIDAPMGGAKELADVEAGVSVARNVDHMKELGRAAERNRTHEMQVYNDGARQAATRAAESLAVETRSVENDPLLRDLEVDPPRSSADDTEMRFTNAGQLTALLNNTAALQTFGQTLHRNLPPEGGRTTIALGPERINTSLESVQKLATDLALTHPEITAADVEGTRVLLAAVPNTTGGYNVKLLFYGSLVQADGSIHPRLLESYREALRSEEGFTLSDVRGIRNYR